MAGIPPFAPYDLPTQEKLPDNILQWAPDAERAVLLVGDMQGFFLDPFDAQLRRKLVRNITRLRSRCRELGVPVAYSRYAAGMTEQERGLLMDYWGIGMSTDPAECDIIPELAPAANDWIHTKVRYSAFFRSGLLERIRAEKRDQLILCGIYAHVGILTTAVEAFSNDIQPFFAADALGDFSEADHLATLEYAVRCCGVVVRTMDLLT
jgi:trans-2,3-dihydro-3-hydroxyanthranilic acid synthase